MLESLTRIVKRNIRSQRCRRSGRTTYQPKVGEVGSAVDIHNYHVLFQVRLKESRKRGQLYRGATSAPPLGSCLTDVFGLVHSFHGHPPAEVVLEAGVRWLRGHIPEAKDYVHHVRRPDAGLSKSILERKRNGPHASSTPSAWTSAAASLSVTLLREIPWHQ